MFKVGDRVKITSFPHVAFGRCGIVKMVNGNGFYYIETNNLKFLCYEDEIERIDDMNISERLSEVIKENQNLKQQISEENIKADINREFRHKRGASDEEFEEAHKFWSNNHISGICDSIYGMDADIPFESLMNRISLSEFVNKYKEYKNKQNEIKVGDECRYKNGEYTFIVTEIHSRDGKDWFNALQKDGSCLLGGTLDFIEKAGRHFDEIETLLSNLKEANE